MATIEGIKALGQLLREARQAKKWTQQEVADKTGLTVGYISNTETGYVNPRRGPIIPSDDALRQFSEALGIPIANMHEALGRAVTLDRSQEQVDAFLEVAERFGDLYVYSPNGTPDKEEIEWLQDVYEARRRRKLKESERAHN